MTGFVRGVSGSTAGVSILVTNGLPSTLGEAEFGALLSCVLDSGLGVSTSGLESPPHPARNSAALAAVNTSFIDKRLQVTGSNCQCEGDTF